MSIETKHPDLIAMADDYKIMRDTFNGERAIKTGTFAYLPATAGQLADGAATSAGSIGAQSYNAYNARAQFPEFVSEAVDLLVSVMHQEPPVIKLPATLEPMRENATRQGLDLDMLLRRINAQQLQYGRFGLLADFPQEPFFAGQATTPHLVEYDAEMITNWDAERMTEFSKSQLTFLVLNETVEVRGTEGIDIFDWTEERRYRVAQLSPIDPAFPVDTNNPLIYSTWTQTDEHISEVVFPAFRGETLDFIPFVFIGSIDLDFPPDEIPLIGLANLSIAIFKKDADYSQALHLLGQDTLVIKGPLLNQNGDPKDESEDTRVGTGAILHVDEDGGDAKFIGIDSLGVPEMRTSIENDKRRAQSMGPRLLESRMGQAESGEALHARVASQTATLQTIVLAGAKGLEKSLKMCAVWIGANPDEVSITPNVDFTQDTIPAAELKALSESTGRPIQLSDQSIHKWLQGKNFTRETFEDEKALIDKEEAARPAPDEPEVDPMRTDDDGTGSGS